MASPRFNTSRVCSILAGDDGELDYMFPGSDDDLEMGEMDMNESEVVTDFLERGGDRDTDEEGSGSDVDFLDRGGDGDTDEGGSGMDEGGSGSGKSMEEDEGRSTRQHSGGRVASRYGVPSQYGVPSRARSRSKGVRGGVEVVEVVAGELPGRHRMTGSRPVQVPQWTLLPSPKSSSHLHRARGSR